MLNHFGVSKANKNIVVAYQPKKDRMRPENFKRLVDSIDRFRGSIDIEFLQDKKIELNAVLATVGPERLWGYFKELLQQEYPTRDYNRAIESHPDLTRYYPIGIRIFNEYIKEHENSIVQKDVEEIESELEDVEGFINVPEKEEEIDKRLGTIIENDELLKEVGSKLEETFKGRDPKRWMELAKKLEEEDKKRREQEEEEKGRSND